MKGIVEATAVVRGKSAFLAGVGWEPFAFEQRRSLKRLARSKGADALASYRYRDEKGKAHLVVGLARLRDLALPRRVSRVYALGLLVSAQLGGGGYAIFALAAGRYAFVGSLGGLLLSDMVGDRAAVEQALETFTTFNPEPDGGWQRFAPEDWSLPGCQPFDLDSLLQARSFPSTARLRSVSLKKPVVGLATAALLVVGSYVAWSLYTEHQLQVQQEEQRRALLAQQQAQQEAAKIVPPWTTAPRVQRLVDACVERWQAAPLSLAGWVFKQAQCSQDGNIRLAYRKPAGGTVGDFAYRVGQLYAGRSSAFFNLPADGETGGFSLGLRLDETRDERPLPSAEAQLRRLTSFAQHMRLNLSLTEEDNRRVTAAGEEAVMPWRVFGLALESSVAPSLLFAELDDVGVRFNTLTVVLNQGRLTYKVEGKVYANP
ncbi:hypothetical protein C5U62_31465 [Pseudomonas protegens]|uniref:Type 4b pilus protein PilO2 n=1 Tax=Pseudomonas protegens TaxID=380021 RepID=A0A2T6GBF7_9PSED|nr:type 4b pilus protein PilO2 [Pseudomonas protegens]PUA41489.1 hypothetical protein C5U62_31465 [Pseudomonas protegens]